MPKRNKIDEITTVILVIIENKNPIEHETLKKFYLRGLIPANLYRLLKMHKIKDNDKILQ